MLSRLAVACFIGALLHPSFCRAAVLEIPALGVRFTNVPAEATAPTVMERPTGSEARFEIGETTLSVYREDAKVPQGSTVKDNRYLQGIRIPGYPPENISRGGQTTIAGYPAWTRQAESSIAPFVIYHRWTAYLIVDGHLYRLLIFAVTREPSVAHFMTAMKAMSGIAFIPVVRPANRSNDASEAGSEPGRSGSRLPRFISSGVDYLYSAQAQRLGEEGDVDVAFNIDRQGHVQELRQFFASAPHLGERIPRFLHNGVFKVGPNWHASGGDQRRYRMEFQFSLRCPAVSKPSPIPNTATVAVCVNLPR